MSTLTSSGLDQAGWRCGIWPRCFLYSLAIFLSIADRPGLAPGLAGGMLAYNGGSGFLGALVSGFLAGYVVIGLEKALKPLPKSLDGIKPVPPVSVH